MTEKVYVIGDDIDEIEAQDGFTGWFGLVNTDKSYFSDDNWIYWGRNVYEDIDYFVARCEKLH